MYKSILVWGSPGAGKTTTALAVAWELVARKKNVIIINTDTTVPNMAVYLPELQTTDDGFSSIGLLLDGIINDSAFKGKIKTHPQSNGCLAFMALCSGETPISYKTFEKSKMVSLLNVLNSKPIDYLIIDGQSNPVHNSMTLLGLEIADIVLRVITPDVKGVEFCSSQLNWLANSVNITTNSHIKIANCCKPQSAVANADACIGGFNFVLPENIDTYTSFSAGTKFGCNPSKEGKRYDKTIKKLVDKVCENEI